MNLRAGGSGATIDRLLERALARDAETLVFSEFRSNAVGGRICATLRRAGYEHQAETEDQGNGVLIAARSDFSAVPNPFGLPDDQYPNAIVQARFGDLTVYGVYLPGQDRKRPHLRCLIAAAQRANQAGAAAMAIGDFNSGRNETDIEANVGRNPFADEFSTADLYAELERHWTEAWLYLHPGRTEFSWYPFRRQPRAQRRNGWRIDKAFVSRALLGRVAAAEYDHGFRLEGLTDHSALIVELAPQPRRIAREPSEAVDFEGGE